ncbi:hypothetical protein KJ780_02315 [Candidatus Micrarchaeota archaeon]|nr:hypothetical protein [Candidatus Micrarchaeota archaeon]
MKILRLNSTLDNKQITERCISLGCLAFSPSLVNSEEEIKLAHFLAEKSFKNKKNIAKTLELEMLLWLCGAREIKKALQKSNFLPNDFILVCLKNSPNEKDFDAKSIPLNLEKKAKPLDLERISLSRI